MRNSAHVNVCAIELSVSKSATETYKHFSLVPWAASTEKTYIKLLVADLFSLIKCREGPLPSLTLSRHLTPTELSYRIQMYDRLSLIFAGEFHLSIVFP